MTDKLLNCPFCGGEAHYDRGRLTGISAVVCPCSSHVFFGAEKDRDATIVAWNTRAERTCRCTTQESAWCFVCSECGKAFPRSKLQTAYNHGEINYCPNCRAKVVGE